MNVTEHALPAELQRALYESPTITTAVEEPDFMELFPAAICVNAIGTRRCFECRGCHQRGPITAQTGFLLHWGATFASDMFVDALRDVSHEQIADREIWLGAFLPPAVRRWLRAQHEQIAERWLGAYKSCFDRLAATLATGQVPYPRCTADEMALHFVASNSLVAIEEVVTGEYCQPTQFPSLFAGDVPPADELHEALLEETEEIVDDQHVLMLFDPAFDGIESSEEGEALGITNMHPRDWFRSFHCSFSQIEFGEVVSTATPTGLPF